MKTIYIDSDFKCYTENAEGRTAIETDMFDGKCGEYIEGYKIKDGVIYPWKPFIKLDAAQRAYEREQLAEAVQTIDELCDYIAEVET